MALFHLSISYAFHLTKINKIMSDSIDSKMLLDFLNKFDTKFDNLYSKLDEKNESNYRRLEEKMDANYDTLDKKISDWITKTDTGFESLKDKVQDHEFRIRNMENARKDQIDKVFKAFGQMTDSGSFPQIKIGQPKVEEDSTFKKIITNPATVYSALVLAVMMFISGNFEPIYKIIGLFIGKP